MRRIIFFFYFLLCILGVYGQAPANDICGAAITLTSDACSSNITYTLQNATQTIAPITCQGSTSTTTAHDVWFKFIATSVQHKIVVIPCSGLDAVVDLRSSPCNGLNLSCSDNGGGAGQMETIDYPSFTVGLTYYIRVYDYGTATSPCFDIFIVSSTPPSNDNCANAINLTPSTTCNATSGKIGGATSSGIPKGSCDNYTIATPHLQDIWYKFTAISTGQYNVIVTPATCSIYCGFDPVVSLYSACGGSQIGCIDAGGGVGNSETLTYNVTSGTTYYIRIYDYGQVIPIVPTFNVCVTYTGCTSISISSSTSNQSVTAPSSATFNISATGSSISYQWQVSTNNGSTWNNVTNSSPYSGATTSTLTVNPSSVAMDGYLYRCFLNNCNTSAYTSWATLTVTSSCTAISVSTNPSSQTVTAPSSATFSCSTSAGTSISYQWEYSSNGGSTWNNVPNSSPYSNTTSSSLFISPTTSSINNFRYRCFLSNTCSSQTTGSATLTVNSIPPVANFTVNRNNIIAGQSVQFTDLSSNAPTLLNWNISGGSPFELHTASASSFSITFHSPGKYNVTLIASNSAGYSSPLTRNAYITVQPQGTNQCIPPPNYCTQQGWYDASVSDPIHLGTGTYKYIHSDLIVSSSINKLVFTRIYNSINNNISGPLGNGWSHSYNYIVYNFSDTLWQVKYPDGHLADFVPLYDGGGSSFALYGGMTDTLYKTATEFNLITKEKNKYKFSLGGQLRSIQDPNSNIISLHYKGNLLDSIVSSSGRFIHLTGDSATGKISSVSSTLGKTCYFSIDSNNNLIAATNPNSDTIHFRYDTSHQLLSFINPLGDTVLTNIYTNGFVTGQYDAYNQLTSISYNSPSVGYTAVTYPDNSQEKYFHNQFTVNTQRTDALNKLSSTTYTENYLPDTITNEKGQNTLLSYDRYGNPLNIKLSGNRNYSTKYNDFQKPTEISNPLGYVTTFNYDSVHGNLKKINFPDTSSRIFEYFTNGTVRYYLDGIGDTTFYFYNSFGDLIKVNSPIGQRRFGYTADGNLDSITDENGNLTLLFYDNNENVIQIKDALNQSLFFSYDKDNQLISFKDKKGYTTYLYYDKKGRKVAQKNAMAGIDSFYYDVRDNLITWKDANGHFTYNGYDAKGRDTSITNAAGITKITYDDIDNIVKITDPNKHIFSLGYNSSNFTNTIVDALLQTDSISYDGIGNTNNYKNYKSNTKSHNYNPLNQLSKTTDVEGKVTTFRHNKNGMLSSFTDGNSNTQNFNFGKSNRLQTYIDAAGNTYSYSYDSVGNIKTINKPVGNITNQYDKLNRLKTQSISTGDVYSFNYDANNNITSASNNTGTSNFFYDSLNRMYKYVDLFGKQVLYGFNPVGSITYIVYPGNDTVKYIYDDANRLWNVIDWKGRIFTYSYDSAGKVKKLLYPNGIRCEYNYDAINRLTSKITYQPNDTILYGQTFSFYNDSIIEFRYGTFPAGIESAQRRYQYSADDAALSDSVRTFRNDSNGNRTKEIFLSDTASYTYTADQLLTSMSKGGVTRSYKYDALGHRLERNKGNDITHFVLNLNSPISLVLQTTDGNGVKKANYVYGLGLLESIDINDSVRYFHFDSGHNTIAITDDNDSVKATYTYLPYGALNKKTGTILQPFTFLGEFGVEQETDSCYYIRARYYDASTGRFLSKDPLFGDGFEPQSLNRYIYSLNSPLFSYDVNGLTKADQESTLNENLTFQEAKNHYQNGNGTAINIDINKIDLSHISVRDFNGGEYLTVNLSFGSDFSNIDDALVHGSITLQYLGNNQVQVAYNPKLNGHSGMLDFDIHRNINAKEFFRNVATIMGKVVYGTNIVNVPFIGFVPIYYGGKPFQINYSGVSTIKP